MCVRISVPAILRGRFYVPIFRLFVSPALYDEIGEMKFAISRKGGAQASATDPGFCVSQCMGRPIGRAAVFSEGKTHPGCEPLERESRRAGAGRGQVQKQISTNLFAVLFIHRFLGSCLHKHVRRVSQARARSFVKRYCPTCIYDP